MTNQSKKRKFLATTLTASMVAAAVAPVAGVAAAENGSFPDVPADHDYAGVIADMAKAGIVAGGTDGNFNLGGKITRAEAAQMVAGLLDLKTGANKNETKFEDVKSNVWYTGAINSLVSEGIIAGISEKVFEPSANITRGQLAQLLVVAYGLEDVDVTDVKLPFTDVDEDAWYTKPIKQLYNAGLIKGQTENTFGPKSDMKRGDFAWLAANVDYELGDKLPKPGVGVEGITSVSAINDTRISVTFGQAIDKDFIREAELNGEYFAVYTEGNAVQSNNTVQSTAINFSPDGKTATFDLNDEIESGKKYYVALLNGDNNKVSDVVHSYGPTVLKSAADAPSFEVSTVSDKVFVKYNAKMKDSAKDVANYTVYDEGSQKLGPLSDFLATDAEGEWVDLNEKKEVEFALSKESSKKLQAGKTYKLVVKADVKTDDNKTLSESNRTITVKTPSVKEASPVAKVARVTGKREITLFFDQDIVSPKTGEEGEVNLNEAQLNLKTSTGKTVDMTEFDEAVVEGDNKLVISFESDVFDAGLTYRVDMPANVVQNGIFTNAMNDSTSNLTAKAQENVSIKTMKADIVADPKNDAKADLILTFDQVPNVEDLTKSDIVLYDGRDKYVLDSDATVKVFGGDTSGKSIIIEDTKKFFLNGSSDDADALQVKATDSYDIEIEKDKLETATFDDAVPATNKLKLKASTKGISVSAPFIDEVVLQSAEKIEVVFEENIKGNVKASDIAVDAFVANRSDIFEGNSKVLEAKPVSGTGYFDVKISGNVLTLTAKKGVKFPTSEEATNITIDEKVITNSTGKVGNLELVIAEDSHDFVDNAAPVIVSAHAEEEANEVTLTYSENVKLQGNASDIATSFFTDKGENASRGVEYNEDDEHNSVTITFKEDVWKNDTDLSTVTLKYSQGNSYYIQDLASNKMKTDTLTGFFSIYNEPTGTTPPVDTVDKTALTDAIGEVVYVEVSAADGADVATDKKWTTQAEKTALEEAVAAAQEVLDNDDATQTEVNEAKNDLDTAVGIYVAAQEDGSQS